jgi:anti-sigma factor RsiW
MTNRYYCDDKERLVTFLYGETSDRERAEVEAHLAGCVKCAEEVDELRAVRVDLAAWQPPEAELGFRIVREPVTASRRWWPVPAWAPVAMAAGVLLALAASVHVEYGNGAIVVRTGWATTSAPSSNAVAGQATPATRGAQPAGQTASAMMSEADVRAALASLESRLRAEMATARTASATPASGAGGAGFDRVALVRQVEGLIEASERRQQRELAFRLAQAMQDVDTQRRSDLVRIENGLGQIEGLTVQEGARQSRLINYLMRTSQER